MLPEVLRGNLNGATGASRLPCACETYSRELIAQEHLPNSRLFVEVLAATACLTGHAQFTKYCAWLLRKLQFLLSIVHVRRGKGDLLVVPLSASSAEILADIPLGWLRTIPGTLAQSAAAF